MANLSKYPLSKNVETQGRATSWGKSDFGGGLTPGEVSNAAAFIKDYVTGGNSAPTRQEISKSLPSSKLTKTPLGYKQDIDQVAKDILARDRLGKQEKFFIGRKQRQLNRDRQGVTPPGRAPRYKGTV